MARPLVAAGSVDDHARDQQQWPLPRSATGRPEIHSPRADDFELPPERHEKELHEFSRSLRVDVAIRRLVRVREEDRK